MSVDIQTVLHAVSKFSYVGVFGFSLLANLFVPVPEEIFLLVLGYLTASGVFNPILVTVIVIVGFSIIDILLYYLARRGNKLLLRGRDKFLKRLAFNDAKIMAHHPNKVIFFARFLMQFRFLGPVLAGSYKVPFKRFFLVNLSALILYVPLVILLGDYFHSRLERVINGIGVARNIVFVVVGIFVAIAIFKFVRSLFVKYLKSTGDKMKEFLGIEITEKEEELKKIDTETL